MTSDAFEPWQGSLLAGGLGSQKLLRLTLEEGQVAGEELILEGEIGRIRDVFEFVRNFIPHQQGNFLQ